MTRREALDMILLGMRASRLLATLSEMSVPAEDLEIALLSAGDRSPEMAAILLEAISVYLEEDELRV